MENLFDFLENKSKEEKQENIILETQTIDISTTQKTKYIIDEEHLKHLEKVKISLYNEDEIKASGLERKDYIRLNSYVGSRLNTDLRAKNNPIKEVDVKIELVEENYLDSLEEVEMDENIFNEDNGIKENKDISIAVPNITLNYLDDIVFIDDYFDLLKYKILSSNNLNIYHDVIEGIDNRIYKYIKESNTLEELISKVKTKRFTYNRIKRILLYILLDIKKDDIKNIKNYIRPLGFNETGKKYLNKIKNNLTLPLINCYSKNKDILSLEYKANLIYSLKTKNINESIKNELNKPIKKQ